MPFTDKTFHVEPHPRVPGFWCVVDAAGFVTRRRTRRAFFHDEQEARAFAAARNAKEARRG
jgi:hypothetical protein